MKDLTMFEIKVIVDEHWDILPFETKNKLKDEVEKRLAFHANHPIGYQGQQKEKEAAEKYSKLLEIINKR
jgi:hypothetical protein